MVLAESPLWVVHSSTNNAAAGGGGGAATNGKKMSEEERDHKEKKAINSLLLFEGLGGTQKCAIYSIDFHPNGQKFATGGGDGTVRLWNAGALFPKLKGKTSKFSSKRDSAAAGGGGDEGGVYVSSGESSAGDNDSHSGSSAADNNGSTSVSEEDDDEEVHDLSSLVRRKKDGSLASPSKKKEKPCPALGEASSAVPNGPSSPSSSSPRHPSKLHHHHHHDHRLLCTLSAHTGSSVLAVRFSTSGQYLASAGDDAVVCIYTKSSSGSHHSAAVAGNLDHPGGSVEHWTRIKLCRGHALDAVGLAWAPDDSHLVSCSLDSNAPIIVWRLTDLAEAQRPTHSNVLCNPYKILGKGIHTSTVKGVTFDPAGTYLASSGDDPSVCIWRAHDDWGLEKRIDANSGIFRRWKENDAQALSSQSLFRRLSWSTDGAYICSTNAVVRNKHVASTVSRDGWAVSSAKSTASGAANLVGHKQPVVACRHCPNLLDSRPTEDGDHTNDDNDEPEYATLLALGDKRGFVTVWSTRRSRPVFKIQCSETRCTVTDLAWGMVGKDLMLLVSLLDGQVVALKFGVPNEVGNILNPEDQARVFQLRYGIDVNDVTDMGRRRLFVGENSGPKFIENALQYSLENEGGPDDDDNPMMNGGDSDGGEQHTRTSVSTADIKAGQTETRVKGKKRIQPFLMTTEPPAKKLQTANGNSGAKKKPDTLEDVMEMAEKAATGAEAATAQNQTKASTTTGPAVEHSGPSNREATVTTTQQPQPPAPFFAGMQAATPQIPHSTDRIHSVELPVVERTTTGFEPSKKVVADCTNSIQIPPGSSGSALPCTVLSISREGQKLWKDQLPGTLCSAIAASKHFLCVGTSDGCLQLYGTSPTLGWTSGVAFRSHPPLVMGRPIVTLQLHDAKNDEQTELLVVSADGSFGVYTIMPDIKVKYKGTILPPMTHMLMSSDLSTEFHLPKMARIQVTETGKLLLLLSLHSNQGRAGHDNNRGLGNSSPSVGAGGSLQAFVYSELSELWMRIADSRFVLSDFYSTLPTTKANAKASKKAGSGPLAKLDDSVRMGASSSTLKNSRRGKPFLYSNADMLYSQGQDDGGNDWATRAHCEDRMACALALGSADEFEFWFSMYIKVLAVSGNESLLRLVVDMLLGKIIGSSLENDDSERTKTESLCWWLMEAPKVFSLDRSSLVKTVIIPEISKNRSLQRITNEISLEVESLK